MPTRKPSILIPGHRWKAALGYLMCLAVSAYCIGTLFAQQLGLLATIVTAVIAATTLVLGSFGTFTLLHPRFRYDPGAEVTDTPLKQWSFQDGVFTHRLRPSRSFHRDDVEHVWWLPGSPVGQEDWEDFSDVRLLVELRDGRFLVLDPGMELLAEIVSGWKRMPLFPTQDALSETYGWLRLTLQVFRRDRKRIRILLWTKGGDVQNGVLPA